jgi:predicted DNA-binding transcriptional regulator AlpA
MAYRFNEVLASIGISRRTGERLRAAGRFPQPDVRINKVLLWRPETILAWIERGGRP